MKFWTASAASRYYFDPTIDFLQAQERGNGRRMAKGYYIVPHCCQDFGGVSRNDLGPFATRLKALSWSRKYMADSSESAH